ncbi:MAG: parallel beta-helix domain-containing protein [Pseudomonadota bacterium]
MRLWEYTGLVVGAALIAACGGDTSNEAAETAVDRANAEIRTITIDAGADFAAELQTALITASTGDTIAMPAGTFHLSDGLSLDVDGVTLTGAGQERTILSFANQTGAGEGLLVTSDDVTLTGFTMQDTAGDGIKSKGADRIIYRDLTVEWTGGPDEDNGAYGVYPVESTDVLVEGVTVRGASDAGIYVGQSSNIIVRNSLAEYNVAGIEIENSTFADVYANRAENNAGGILVFDLPDLPVIGGHSTRIFDNTIINNNTRNFAPPGNIVASVPSGTGVIILANRNVHVFDNQFDDNRTAHVLLTAYQDPFTDERYNPLPRDIRLTGNAYANGGYDPQGVLGDLAGLLGGSLPPIVWDGVNRWGESEAVDVNLSIEEGETVATPLFLNLGFGAYPLDPANLAPSFDMPDGTAAPDAPTPVSLSHAGAG